MRTGLTITQTNILDQDTYLDASWLFEIDLGATGSVDYYWSTKVKSWDSQSYLSKILNFTPIDMAYTGLRTGLQSPADITIDISNPKTAEVLEFDPDDFEGAYVVIKLVINANLGIKDNTDTTFETGAADTDNEAEREILSLGFRVKRAWTKYQKLHLHCVDWLQEYLEGDYPDTGLVDDLFPVSPKKDDEDSVSDNICIPEIYGNPYFPVRWAIMDDGTKNFYVLGPAASTLDVTEVRSPKDENSMEWSPSSAHVTFSFDTTKVGTDGNSYKIGRFFTLVPRDGNDDFTATPFYGPTGGPYKDVPIKMSNSATVSVTNIIDQIYAILQGFGVATDKIDTDSKTAAAAVITARGITYDTPLYYRQDRKKLLAKLLTIANCRLIVRDKIYFKINSSSTTHVDANGNTQKIILTKRWVINKNDVGEGTFNISPIISSDKKDSGYVVYREAGKPIDWTVKLVVPVKTAAYYISNTTIEAEYISDSEKAQKVAKLALQRELLRKNNVSALLKPKCLQMECGDFITVGPPDYGGSFDIMITRMRINRDLSVNMSAISFTDTIDDWDAVTADAVTPFAETSTVGLVSPVTVAPESAPSDNPNDGTLNTLIMANITGTLADISGDLDDITDGGSFKKIKAAAVNGSNEIIMAEIDGDIDDIGNGTTYAKIKATSVNASGIVLLDQTVEGTYGLVKATSINASGLIIMNQVTGDIDDVDNGSTYGRVYLTNLSAGSLRLSSATSLPDGTLRVAGTNQVLLSSDEGLVMYNLSNAIKVKIDLDGHFCFGDSSDGTAANLTKGFAYDGTDIFFKTSSSGKFIVSSGGDIIIEDGGDIILEGDNTSPGIIKFKGTSYEITMGGDVDGDRFMINPSNSAITFYIGATTFGGATGIPFNTIYSSCKQAFLIDCIKDASNSILIDIQAQTAQYINFTVKEGGNTGSYSWHYDEFYPSTAQSLGLTGSRWGPLFCAAITCTTINTQNNDITLGTGSVKGTASRGELYFTDGDAFIKVTESDGSPTIVYEFRLDYFRPSIDSSAECGSNSNRWQDGWFDAISSPADFFFCDSIKKDDKIIAMDDLATIKEIKPLKDTYDPRSGLNLIDDNTVPEWMFTKNRETKEISRTSDGKPYFTYSVLISLNQGCIRQLDAKDTAQDIIIKNLTERVEALEKCQIA